jgi:superfamily II DNA or RNA helicase
MAQRSVGMNRRVIFACHRDAILNQISKTLSKFNVRHGYIASSRPSNPFALAHVASADTLRNRLHELDNCKLLIVDEGHLWHSRTRKLIIDYAKEKGAKIVILTATPIRLDGKPLSDIADHMVMGPTEAEMIERGSLAQYRVFAPVNADLSGVHSRMGDFVVSEVAEKLDKPSIVGDAPQTWLKYAKGLRTVVYAINRAHGKHVLEAYLAAGIKAAYIDGDTPKGEQLRIAHALADGEIDVLISVELLTTGYDLGSLVDRDVTIQCVQLLRPTKSLQLAVQMMMRCMTPWGGVSVILDHVNMILNRDGTINHGFPDDIRDWSLDGSGGTRQEGVADFNVWTCKTCFASVRSTKPVCPYCEKEHTIKPREIPVEDGELQEIKRQQAIEKKNRRIEVGRAKDLDALADIAIDRKYKTGWLITQAKQKHIHPRLPWKDACAAMMFAQQRARNKVLTV